MIRGIRKAVNFIPSEAPSPFVDPRLLHKALRKNAAHKLLQLRNRQYSRSKRYYANAFNQGFAQGTNNALLKEQEEVLKLTKKYSEEIRLLHSNARKAAFIVAEKIIAREINRDASYITLEIEDVLARQLSTQEITIQVNAEELSIIQAQITNASPYHWVAAPDTPLGTAYISTPFGDIHINWRNSLKELMRLIETD